MFTSVFSIGRAYRHNTQRFRSRTPRLITLVTSIYRKTNVFLTTVGTATPPEGKMGEWSPLIRLLVICHQTSLIRLHFARHVPNTCMFTTGNPILFQHLTLISKSIIFFHISDVRFVLYLQLLVVGNHVLFTLFVFACIYRHGMCFRFIHFILISTAHALFLTCLPVSIYGT